MEEVGIVRGLYRYPVKSFAGEALETASLGWHGVEGDRRFAFVREQNESGFPWLTAGRLPEMLRYRPTGPASDDAAPLPSRVATPDGLEVELWGDDLRRRLTTAYGEPVRLYRLDRGVFDDATLSLISTNTIGRIERDAGIALDVRRFRPNVLVEVSGDAEFPEDAWVGRVVVFGNGPAMSVERRDLRCSMINFDPDTGVPTPAVLKAVGSLNEVYAGVYGSTFRTGVISQGDRVYVSSQ
jgi:uncharacterized protein